jgi:hypothetical protein
MRVPAPQVAVATGARLVYAADRAIDGIGVGTEATRAMARPRTGPAGPDDDDVVVDRVAKKWAAGLDEAPLPCLLFDLMARLLIEPDGQWRPPQSPSTSSLPLRKCSPPRKSSTNQLSPLGG